jgi:hypothetical protein
MSHGSSFRKCNFARSNYLGKIGHNVSMSVLSCFVAKTQAVTSAVDRVNRVPAVTSTLIFVSWKTAARISVSSAPGRARCTSLLRHTAR